MPNLDYETNVKEYVRISNEVKIKLTSVSVVIIGAIYFSSESLEDEILLRISLCLLLLTMIFEIIAGYLKVIHYSRWIDGKIESIDFRSTLGGRVAQFLFFGAILPFVTGIILFAVRFLKI